jgi:hypothetical protein
MITPSCQPAALTSTQIEELNKQLTTMRHNINNYLSLMMAAVELVRRKPEAAERMASTLTDQPLKVTEAMKKFTTEFETTLGIQRS